MNYKTRLITFVLAVTFIPTSVSASSWQKSSKKSDLQPATVTKTKNNFSFFASSFKPPKKGHPKYTIGGATRGDSCAMERENENEVTALVPEKNQSLTLQSHPVFFAYVSPMNGDKAATLIVKDKTEDYYYSQQLTIPPDAGIVKMTLAEDAPQLEVDRDYTWFLRIQCNADLEPEDPQISASIMRVEGNTPKLTSQSDLMSFYANSQIWYESLNYAFELSQSGENFYWSQLLTDISFAAQ